MAMRLWLCSLSLAAGVVPRVRRVARPERETRRCGLRAGASGVGEAAYVLRVALVTIRLSESMPAEKRLERRRNVRCVKP
eukprot:3590405-Prymnesium_polylepis.1